MSSVLRGSKEASLDVLLAGYWAYKKTLDKTDERPR
jgi:hypothetical protein